MALPGCSNSSSIYNVDRNLSNLGDSTLTGASGSSITRARSGCPTRSGPSAIWRASIDSSSSVSRRWTAPDSSRRRRVIRTPFEINALLQRRDLIVQHFGAPTGAGLRLGSPGAAIAQAPDVSGRRRRPRPVVLDRRTGEAPPTPHTSRDGSSKTSPMRMGASRPVATIFLTGRECPWRCVMCDLWQHTTAEDTPSGAIPRPDRRRRATDLGGRAEPAGVKLYNAGSFFDPRAVPRPTTTPSPPRLAGTRHVVVESHPALVGARIGRLREALARHRLPAVPSSARSGDGPRDRASRSAGSLNKRMTLDDFARGGRGLRRRGVSGPGVPSGAPAVHPGAGSDRVAAPLGRLRVRLRRVGRLADPHASGNGTMEALARRGLSAAGLARPRARLRARRPRRVAGGCSPISGTWTVSRSAPAAFPHAATDCTR